MGYPRRFWAGAFLALAIAFSQYAAVLHELGHAIEHVSHPAKHHAPGSDSCDQCSAYSPFFGSAPASVAHLAIDLAGVALLLFVLLPAPARTVVTARSRAPPVLR
jgi:hypothetical protein